MEDEHWNIAHIADLGFGYLEVVEIQQHANGNAPLLTGDDIAFHIPYIVFGQYEYHFVHGFLHDKVVKIIQLSQT